MSIKEYVDLQTCTKPRIRKIETTLKKAKEIIGKDLTKLKLPDITKFLREINNSDFAQWTKNDYKKIFKGFLKWKYKKDYLEWSESKNFQEGFKGVSKKKAFNKEKINKNTLLKPKELEKILRACKNLKWKALLTLLYESAFRPCELINLKWKDLTFEDSKAICSVRTTSPKTKETRNVPVKDCIVHLKRWRDEYEFPNRTENDLLFSNPNTRGKILQENSIGVMLGRLCERAGVRHLFPYMFRHTRIYEVQKKLGARLASKFAGHSIETSEIYNHLDDDDVEEAMLEKVIVTKELTPEEKDELKLDVNYLKEQVHELQNYIIQGKKGNHKPITIKKLCKVGR